MSADELYFCIHDALACQIGQNLVPEKVWVNTLFDLGFASIFFHNLPNPTYCKLRHPIRLEQVNGAFFLLNADVLGQFSSKIEWKQYVFANSAFRIPVNSIGLSITM